MIYVFAALIVNFLLILGVIGYLVWFHIQYNLHSRITQSFCLDYADFREKLIKKGLADKNLKTTTLRVANKDFVSRRHR